MNISTEFESVENRTLFAGTGITPQTTKVTLFAGQGVLPVGAVLGVVTADGKAKLVDKNASDGSEVAKFILAEEVDTSDADIESVAYSRGLFNADALLVAEGDTVLDHQEELREVGIYIKSDY